MSGWEPSLKPCSLYLILAVTLPYQTMVTWSKFLNGHLTTVLVGSFIIECVEQMAIALNFSSVVVC